VQTKLQMESSLANHFIRQSQRQFGPDTDTDNDKDFNDHKGDDSQQNMGHGNIGCDVLNDIQVQPHRRRYQTDFEIHRHDDRKPDGVKSQPLYDREQQRRHH